MARTSAPPSRNVKRPSPPKSRRRRCLAFLFGLALLATAELLCILFNWGSPSLDDDPFVNFESVRPLFALNETQDEYEIAADRRRYFAPGSFAATKPANGFRVFCLGGSTVQGRPYSVETSFTTWLEMTLQLAAPDRQWEVVNCGGVSYASYRLVPILRECLEHQPDLIIIATGHNEFLEDRTYAPIREQPPFVQLAQNTIGRLRTCRLAHQLLANLTGREQDLPSRPTLNTEVTATLDFQSGIDAYERNPQWRSDVVAHYEQNVHRMIAMAKAKGVPVLLVRPPANLADCPPFKSQHREGLTDAEWQRWRALMDEAHSLAYTQPNDSIPFYEEALAIDPQYALTHFMLGKCYQAIGAGAAARDAFVAARDLDICPLRMPVELNDALARVARQTGTPLVDAFDLLEPECPGAVLGHAILDDHIHPNFHGHQLIANALFAEMRRQGWPPPRNDDWHERQRIAFQRQLDDLPETYYLNGRRVLTALEGWARGRVEGKPWQKSTANAGD